MTTYEPSDDEVARVVQSQINESAATKEKYGHPVERADEPESEKAAEDEPPAKQGLTKSSLPKTVKPSATTSTKKD